MLEGVVQKLFERAWYLRDPVYRECVNARNAEANGTVQTMYLPDFQRKLVELNEDAKAMKKMKQSTVPPDLLKRLNKDAETYRTVIFNNLLPVYPIQSRKKNYIGLGPLHAALCLDYKGRLMKSGDTLEVYMPDGGELYTSTGEVKLGNPKNMKLYGSNAGLQMQINHKELQKLTGIKKITPGKKMFLQLAYTVV